MHRNRLGLAAALALAVCACTPESAGRSPVTPPGGARLTITTGTVTCPTGISVGQTAQCNAYFYDQNNNLVTSVTPTWGTNTPTLISVSSTGEITGLAVGTAEVHATASGVTGSTNVTVTPGLTIGISGPATVRRFTSCTWGRTVSGGTSPYTYYWEDTNGNPSGTASTYTATVVSAGDDVSLTVTDANGVQATTTKHITSTTTAPLC